MAAMAESSPRTTGMLCDDPEAVGTGDATVGGALARAGDATGGIGVDRAGAAGARRKRGAAT
jgi:hypothetical protein